MHASPLELDRWTVHYDQNDDFASLEVAYKFCPSLALELLIFHGGGFIAGCAAWRLQSDRSVLRLDRIALA